MAAGSRRRLPPTKFGVWSVRSPWVEQVGMRSGMVESGYLLPESERLIAHFERQLVDALGTDVG